MTRISRRKFLASTMTAAAAATLGLARRAHAIGNGSLFRIAEIGWTGLQAQSAPRSSGLSRLGTDRLDVNAQAFHSCPKTTDRPTPETESLPPVRVTDTRSLRGMETRPSPDLLHRRPDLVDQI